MGDDLLRGTSGASESPGFLSAGWVKQKLGKMKEGLRKVTQGLTNPPSAAKIANTIRDTVRGSKEKDVKRNYHAVIITPRTPSQSSSEADQSSMSTHSLSQRTADAAGTIFSPTVLDELDDVIAQADDHVEPESPNELEQAISLFDSVIADLEQNDQKEDDSIERQAKRYEQALDDLERQLENMPKPKSDLKKKDEV